GCILKVVPFNEQGELRMDLFAGILSSRTKLVSITHVSNAMGTVNPVGEIIRLAHKAGAVVFVDAAQGVSHEPIDVQAWDCDFLAFSAHKLYGPTGVGVLYGKQALLESMPPYQSGGDMILSVTFDKTIFNRLPFKFEAGTPNIAGVIALGDAISYVKSVGWDGVVAHKNELLEYGQELLKTVPGLRMLGTAAHKAPVFSFVLENIHAHDIGTLIDREGVAIRTGHHCAQPVMKHFGVPATARASLAFYNTKEELDIFVTALHKIIEVFK
ncbi:MAG: cysteine desulfurase, partial [Candidatus Omnitrophota bacterium]